MFGVAAMYNGSVTAGAENSLSAVSDNDLVVQNSNFIFAGNYNLLEELLVGASIQYGRYNIAQWNGRGRPNISAVNRNATVTQPSYWHRYPGQGLTLPTNQQMPALATNNLSMGNEKEALLWKLCSTDWNMNLPGGAWDIILHATCTITPTAGAWSINNAITFDQAPVGGSFAVIGAQCIGANAYAFRIHFPMRRLWNGTGLHPGGVVLNAYGQTPPLFNYNDFGNHGVWGFFSTYQPPALDILGQTASSTTYDLFMLCRYLGMDTNIATQMAGTAY